MTNIDKSNKENLSYDKATDVTFGSNQYDEQKISIRDCPERGNDTSNTNPFMEMVHTYKDAPRNKILKWLRLLAEDRAINVKVDVILERLKFLKCVSGRAQIVM